MTLLASTLITTSKQRAFAAIGPQKVSDAMLLAELSHQDQLVIQLLTQTAPDLLSIISGSITFTDSGNLNGYTLENGLHYRDFVHVDSASGRYTPIDIVQRQYRQDAGLGAPSAMIRTGSAAGVFHPIDPLGKRWTDGDTRLWYAPGEGHTLIYSYTPIPSVLTSLSDTLDSPDMAREIFVAALEVRIILSNSPKTEAATAVWQARVQAALAALGAAQTSFQFQAYKFVHPQGQPGGRGSHQSDTGWVSGQVAG